jgi:hypothetical protein
MRILLQEMFSEYLPEFYVRAADPPLAKLLKLRCLVALVDNSNVRPLLKELLVSEVSLLSETISLFLNMLF